MMKARLAITVGMLFTAMSCGARTPLDTSGLPTPTVDASRFYGFWFGDRTDLPANHPFCGATPNNYDVVPGAPPLQNACVVAIRPSPIPNQLIGEIEWAPWQAFRPVIDSNETALHELIAVSPTQVTFVPNRVSTRAAAEPAVHQVSGTATLEGDEMVLRICWQTWDGLGRPSPRVASLCHLRRQP